MNRRAFMAGVAVSLPLAAHNGLVRNAVAEAVSETGSAHFSKPVTGFVTERYRLTLDRVLHGSAPAYTPEFLLEDIHATGRRRFTNFSGDVSGRWIGALASSSLIYGEKFPVLDDTVHRIIALQKPEGYFGKVFRYQNQDDNDMALLWGNGRLLVGLMEYYALNPQPEVLLAAQGLGDFLVRISPDFNTQKKADEFGAAHYGSSYICWTQQTEGLAALYAVTHDARYRDLCLQIATRIERRPSDHVHGYLCSLRGIVQMHERTGDPLLLDKAVAEWNNVMRSGDLLVTGGVPERWSPLRLRTEGCAECDWLRLNLALYRVTGKAVYLETAERTIFNEFCMNQFASGDFGHGELDANGTPVALRTRAWWCCTFHGLRAFPDIYNSAFRIRERDVFYDLAVDGAIRTDSFSAQATSHLSTEKKAEVLIAEATGQSLSFRRPAWAEAVALTRNGRSVQGLRVEELKAGDRIEAKYTMALREERAGDTGPLATRRTLFYGPWLLGTSSQVTPAFFNEHQPANQLIRGQSAPLEEQQPSPFAAPVAATSYGYIPSEFPDEPSRVELRAVAEQTSMQPTAAWETTFLIGENTASVTVTG